MLRQQCGSDARDGDEKEGVTADDSFQDVDYDKMIQLKMAIITMSLMIGKSTL